jgi:selenocysteine lyase/cysteine desulfurase
LDKYRKHFKVTEKFIYFNHAAVSPLNTYALNYANKFLEDAVVNGSINYKNWLKNVDTAKDIAADLIKASSDEIAIIKNTTSGILLVANGLRLKPGDNIIIPEKEFPANVYPWLNLKKKGIEVRFAKWTDGRVLIDDLLKLIDKRTRLLSISHVQFTNGFKIDLEELGHHLKKKGVLFFVDAIQSMGVFDIDVKKCNIDFLAADSHKWLLGPEGVGFFYCKNSNLDLLELDNFGYTSVINSDNYLDYNMTLRPDASRFEEGSLNMLGIHTALGSLKLIKEVTREKVKENIISLTDYLVDRLEGEGCTVRSPRRDDNEKSGIVSFVSKNHSTKKLYLKLMRNNCYVALRDNAIRLSPHFYNSTEEGARLIDLVSK